MFNKLKDRVVVVTGASSGIGRATALRLAEKKAYVVAGARRRGALESLAQQCHQRGTAAIPVVTDVTDEEAVERLAGKALEHFGHIDAWINNAAVGLFARFEEAPPEAFRRVLETNLFGYVHGARAALRYFRDQGYGTLINVSSMLGQGGAPYESAYVTSKFGINGLSMCLRQELKGTDINVSVVMPASVDTPLFQQAANYTGRVVKPIDPVFDPDKVAKTIVKLVKRPRDMVYVGNAGRMMGALRKVSPRVYESAMVRQVEKDHFQDEAAPPRSGNLFEPQEQWGRVDGGWANGRGLLKNGAAKVAVAGLLMALPAMAYAMWPSKTARTVSKVRALLPG